MLVDLHVHSTESDGSFTPEQLVDEAVSKGLSTLALCDHDTTSGHKRFIEYGEGEEITLIAGIELSATWKDGNCHILGYNVRDDHDELENALRKIRAGRGSRNEVIVEKLNELGIKISMEEVLEKAGGEVVSRPHMAQVMHEKGSVGSVQEAFDKYLAKGAAAYADRYRLDPEDAVKLLRDAGATVVLAHPTQLKLSEEKLFSFVESLLEYGLGGIEVYTPYATDKEVETYRNIALKNNLVITGGSDFHGVSKPDHYLGYFRDNGPIPAECTLALCENMNIKKESV